MKRNVVVLAYASTGRNFILECQQNQIGGKLAGGFETASGTRPNRSEVE
jgi:hypothetical protein